MKEPYYIYRKPDGDEIEIEILDMAEYRNATYISYKQWDPFAENEHIETGILRIWMKYGEISKVSAKISETLLKELMILFADRRNTGNQKKPVV